MYRNAFRLKGTFPITAPKSGFSVTPRFKTRSAGLEISIHVSKCVSPEGDLSNHSPQERLLLSLSIQNTLHRDGIFDSCIEMRFA